MHDHFTQTNAVPEGLYECVVEVDERVVLQQTSCQLYDDYPTSIGVTGEKVCVASCLLQHICILYPLNVDAVM